MPARGLVRGFSLVALVLIGVTVAVIALFWARNESLDPVSRAPGPSWTPIVPSPPSIEATANFVVTRSQKTEIPSPPWFGTVTSVNLEEGVEINSRARAPISIDGIDRPWFTGPFPLFRSIGSGTSGADVDLLAIFLEDAGFLAPDTQQAGEPVTRALISAVRAWAVAHGHSDRSLSSFDPAWVTWLPENIEGDRVFSVLTSVGKPAPTTGTPWLVTGGEVSAISMTTASEQSTPTLKLEEIGTTVVIAGEEFAWTSGRLTDSGLEKLDTVLESDREEVSLRLIYHFPTSFAVPASAIEQDGSVYCMTVTDDPEIGPYVATEVSILGTQPGVVVVNVGGGFVLVNPASVAISECS